MVQWQYGETKANDITLPELTTCQSKKSFSNDQCLNLLPRKTETLPLPANAVLRGGLGVDLSLCYSITNAKQRKERSSTRSVRIESLVRAHLFLNLPFSKKYRT